MLRRHVRLLTCDVGPSKVVALGVVKALLSKRKKERKKKEHRVVQLCMVEGGFEPIHLWMSIWYWLYGCTIYL